MSEIKGAIQVKAGNGKGFIITDVEGWFNCADANLLAKFNKGDKVTVIYELSGKIKKVSDIIGETVQIKETVPEVKKETPKPSTTGFACAVCGKELKDGRFQKCYECNMASKTGPSTGEPVGTASTRPASGTAGTSGTITGFKCVDCGASLKDNKYTKCWECNKKNPVKKQWKPKSNNSFYGTPEDIAGKQKGCALGAAASVLSGADCLKELDPEGIAQVTRIVADSLLDYLKQE